MCPSVCLSSTAYLVRGRLFSKFLLIVALLGVDFLSFTLIIIRYRALACKPGGSAETTVLVIGKDEKILGRTGSLRLIAVGHGKMR